MRTPLPLHDASTTLIVARTTLTLLDTQMDAISDYLRTIQELDPQLPAYIQLHDHVWATLQDLNEKLKSVR